MDPIKSENDSSNNQHIYCGLVPKQIFYVSSNFKRYDGYDQKLIPPTSEHRYFKGNQITLNFIPHSKKPKNICNLLSK